MKFQFTATAMVSLTTIVEADGLDEAIEEANSRSPMNLCNCCSNAENAKESWAMDSIDYEPEVGEGTSVSVSGVELISNFGIEEKGFFNKFKINSIDVRTSMEVAKFEDFVAIAFDEKTNAVNCECQISYLNRFGDIATSKVIPGDEVRVRDLVNVDVKKKEG